MTGVGEAGPRGERARSDCWVRVEIRDGGGIDLGVRSKVEAMYGEAVRRTCRAVLDALGVRHAVVSVEDQGALDFVLAARLEAAVKRAGAGGGATFLPPSGPGADAPPARDRLRRSRLYLPGNEPRYFVNAGSTGPMRSSSTWRTRWRRAEGRGAAPGAERPAGPSTSARASGWSASTGRPRARGHGRRGAAERPGAPIPKAESAEQVRRGGRARGSGAPRGGLREPCFLVPIIETALGCFARARSPRRARTSSRSRSAWRTTRPTSASSARRGPGVALGLARRWSTRRGPRGWRPCDSVFSDVADLDGLRAAVLEARALWASRGRGASIRARCPSSMRPSRRRRTRSPGPSGSCWPSRTRPGEGSAWWPSAPRWWTHPWSSAPCARCAWRGAGAGVSGLATGRRAPTEAVTAAPAEGAGAMSG